MLLGRTTSISACKTLRSFSSFETTILPSISRSSSLQKACVITRPRAIRPVHSLLQPPLICNSSIAQRVLIAPSPCLQTSSTPFRCFSQSHNNNNHKNNHNNHNNHKNNTPSSFSSSTSHSNMASADATPNLTCYPPDKPLTKAEYQVIRLKGTELPGSGQYDHFYPKSGFFRCRGCGNPLYPSSAKFSSGCGWPAFDKCYAGAVKTTVDKSFGRVRTEITCARCDGHLGHVFEGELMTESNERHCVNSVSVVYDKGEEPAGLRAVKVL